MLSACTYNKYVRSTLKSSQTVPQHSPVSPYLMGEARYPLIMSCIPRFHFIIWGRLGGPYIDFLMPSITRFHYILSGKQNAPYIDLLSPSLTRFHYILWGKLVVSPSIPGFTIYHGGSWGVPNTNLLASSIISFKIYYGGCWVNLTLSRITRFNYIFLGEIRVFLL